MSVQTPSRLLDVCSLAGTREVVAYKDGGLFPVLALEPGGIIVAALRGGAGHIGIEGRMDVIRSFDGGTTWTPPSVVADSESDDRNPAFGVTDKGTLILSYHRQGNYNEQGAYTGRQGDPDRIETMVTRSHNAGRSWEAPYPLGSVALSAGSPYGKIVQMVDGTLLLPIYGPPVRSLLPEAKSETFSDRSWSYVIQSHDDGRTWEEPLVIATGMNETGLMVLPDGGILAVMRSEDGHQGLHATHSEDGGHTWSAPVQVTSPAQHPADLIALSNGDILLAYGNRNPPYRVEGRVSRDGGRSWLDLLLTFSGHLYGYDVPASRSTDLGYPSSVVWRTGGTGRGVTMYYYDPSALRERLNVERHESNPFYSNSGYYAIALTWDEAELILAIE